MYNILIEIRVVDIEQTYVKYTAFSASNLLEADTMLESVIAFLADDEHISAVVFAQNKPAELVVK